MVMDVIYNNMIQKLKAMDEKQLLELWHDIDDVAAVQRICDTSYEYTENFDYNAADRDIDDTYMRELIDDDNAQRARDCAAERGARKC
jgi:hypothetical protein